MLKRTMVAMLAGFISWSSFASVETVKTNLAKQHPDLKIENIQSTEMPGIYSGSMDVTSIKRVKIFPSFISTQFSQENSIRR